MSGSTASIELSSSRMRGSHCPGSKAVPTSGPLRHAVHASAKSLKTAWCIVGVSLLAIVAIEFGLRLLFFAKDTVLDKPRRNWGVFQDYGSDDSQAEPWQIKYEE